MNTFNNSLKSILLGGTLLLSAGSSLAAPDFDRINKDVTVMSNIIKGAFEADENCKGCTPKISASYLANQGAVFTFRVSSWRSFSMAGDDSSYSFVIPAPEEVRHIEITEVVSDVLDNLGTVMDDVGNRIEYRIGDLDDDKTILRLDSEARRAMRDLVRERRELEYERREYEIELIHADEQARRDLEKQIAAVEKQVSKVEQKQAELNKVYETERKERELVRQEKREKAKKQAEEKLATIENIVIKSLCDYGAALKNIPEGEHVSLLFERSGVEDTKVFVMEMSDVESCRASDSLRKEALVYNF